MEKLHVIRY